MAADRRLFSAPNRRATFAWVVFAVVAGFYLWTEHRAHLWGVLPYLLLLACPLMHLLMHGGHRHEHGDAPKPGAAGQGVPK